MAKCDLSIELDDPQAVYFGGGTISGIVRVHADADVTCNGLEVKTVWRTHGRGNVDQSEAGSATLFTGHWQAGKQYEYRFELPVAQWPPTYHGFYLNVDHYVDARAKIPWAFDPKASAQFAMRPSADPDVAAANKAIVIEGRAAQVVGCIFALAFLPFMIFLCAAGPFALFFLLLPIGGGIFWLVRYGLPKWMLGNVRCELAAERFQPGERVSGELVIQPRKQVSIDHINMDFTAREQCVSGSGSNRTTHR